MRWIATRLTSLGDWLISLSNRTRLQLVLLGLALLGGGGVYKLVASINELQKPLPAATPDQLIKPMEGLIRQTNSGLTDYRLERNKRLRKLDSLKVLYNTKTNTDR